MSDRRRPLFWAACADGSGHSVLPVQDVFPRYGSYPVFHPLLDARLMWQDVLGSRGAKGLLWLERQSGYAKVLFENEPIRSGDVMVVFLPRRDECGGHRGGGGIACSRPE